MKIIHFVSAITKTGIVFSFLLFALTFSNTTPVFAGAGENVTGWAWGGTASLDGAYQGAGWISFNNLTDGSATNYGVNVPATDGNLTGYAWSEHYGWLSFNSSDLGGCPTAPCSARRVGSTIQGWAKFSTATADPNWSGWVSLSAVNVTPSNVFTGYAWSDDLGWIQMSLVPSVDLWFSFFNRVESTVGIALTQIASLLAVDHVFAGVLPR
jgi:hypothetical protein